VIDKSRKCDVCHILVYFQNFNLVADVYVNSRCCSLHCEYGWQLHLWSVVYAGNLVVMWKYYILSGINSEVEWSACVSCTCVVRRKKTVKSSTSSLKQNWQNRSRQSQRTTHRNLCLLPLLSVTLSLPFLTYLFHQFLIFSVTLHVK